MPAKRRRAKAARKTVSARACEIFQATPQAIVPPVIVDAELARELERPALLAQADIEELMRQLSAGEPA